MPQATEIDPPVKLLRRTEPPYKSALAVRRDHGAMHKHAKWPNPNSWEGYAAELSTMLLVPLWTTRVLCSRDRDLTYSLPATLSPRTLHSDSRR